MEKILKTLESLKVPTLSSLDSSFSGSITTSVVAAGDTVKTKKKERISHCISVTDAICSSSIQTLGDFTKILENATEVLFQLCNDPNPEIRLVAVDCLHRIVRTVRDQYQHRFQMEIYKEIKKNQNPRSLRVALALFAFMSPLIRPQKCRVFMLSLLPCFAQIAKRTEENLFEHMVPAFCEILKNLGPFINDNEVKMLCKDFLANLESTSAIIRRSSACILVYICQYSRKPHVFLPKLLLQVIEILVPNLMEKSVAVIIGGLQCIRQCIQPLYQQLRENFERKSPDQDNVVKNLIQVYEMCMILCNHDDHNVITTSLDTLVQLLNCPVEQVIQRLTSPSGIQNSIDADSWEGKAHESQISSSMCSLEFSDATNLLEGDSDVPNFRSMISSGTSEVREDFDVDVSVTNSRRNSEVFVMEGNRSPYPIEPEFGSSMEALPHSSDEEQLLKAYSLGVMHFPEIQIGSLYEANIPLFYCARFMVYNFLLAGQKGHERSDAEVRISVKVLAMNCIKNIITLCPGVFFLPLPADEGSVDARGSQSVEDVLLYLKHSDPVLRGSTYALVGSLIHSILRSTTGVPLTQEQRIAELVPQLIQGLRDTSNIGVKCAIGGISACLVTILRTQKGHPFVTEIIETLLATARNSYWLVKVDLVELLATVEWNHVPNRERRQEEVLHLFLDLLTDEDGRVRTAASNALILYIRTSHSTEVLDPSILCDRCVMETLGSNTGNTCRCSAPEPAVLRQLERVLNQVLARVEDQDDKFAIAGLYSALASLSENFPPENNRIFWRCESTTRISSLFAICIDNLRSSPVVYDTAIHCCVLSVATSLFVGLHSAASGSSFEGNFFALPDDSLSAHGMQLVQHCLAIIKLYQSLLESTSFTQSQSRRLSTSPVLSPVKKFSQKLENEKKVLSEEAGRKSKGISSASSVCGAHFKKIGEVLGQNWKVYRSNLDQSVTVKFTSLLVTALDSLGQIFERIQPDYGGLASLMDEVLSATYSVFHLCPIPTIHCVQKMLSCLFHRNLEDPNKTNGPWADVTDSVERFLQFSKGYHTVLLSHSRGAAVKRPHEKSVLGGYIRQFEPIVVNALRMYTTSSDVKIQAEVLRLLSQLIKGHVNYGLVDKSQVFLGFVIKQIGFLEEGHIKNDGEMVGEMFEFLTLLSHEHQHSNRFIDIPKILRLCDGLVASGQNPLTHCIPALKKVVLDLFVQRTQLTQTNLERKELEAQREVVFQMLMKLSTIPQALPILWVIIQSRRTLSEVKWNEDSMTVTAYLLPLIESGELQVTNRRQFCGLMALLFSVSEASLPRARTIVSGLEESIKLSKHTKAADFLQWQLLVTTHWLLLVRLHCSTEVAVTSHDFDASFIVNLIGSYLKTLSSVSSLTNAGGDQEFVIELLRVFLHGVCTFLTKGRGSRTVQDLKSEALVESWKDLMVWTRRIVVLEPAVVTDAGRILCAILHPDPSVWSALTEGLGVTGNVVLQQLMKALSETPVPSLEGWLATSQTKAVIGNFENPAVVRLLGRLSADNLDAILDELEKRCSNELEVKFVKGALNVLQQVYSEHLERSGRISLRLLGCTREEFLLLEISQFACFVYTKLKAENAQLSAEHFTEINNFLSRTALDSRYSRLISILKSLDGELAGPSPLCTSGTDSPIRTWYEQGLSGCIAIIVCRGDVSRSEGVALAKLLSTLSYSQIVGIFNQSDFNFAVLSHCFTFLKNMFMQGSVSAEEVLDLFTSEKRSALIGTVSLGVAAFDFLLETLDSWENVIDEWRGGAEQEGPLNVQDVPFGPRLVHMWRAMEEMLDLKRAVITSGISRNSFRNNFIATKIFTFSFEFVHSKISDGESYPVAHLREFLSFATAVISDSSFLKFFNAKEDPTSLFVCIRSLGAVARYIARCYKLKYPFTQSESWWLELNPEFAHILLEMSHSIAFISQVETGKLTIAPTVFKPFRELTAGLGRCDVINPWVLMCHLGWKPPCSESSQAVIPTIQNIPLDILQNEKDLLLQYISKLNLFGVGSKLQFEENWMIFLSVISSYGDENSQLQIVCTGLRALTMVLEKAVKVRCTLKSDKRRSDVVKALDAVGESLRTIEPVLCTEHSLPNLYTELKRELDNLYEVDLNSCIRFLTDLFSQWLQNPHGKMPLLLLSEVVQCILHMAEYFEDGAEFSWMFDTLIEIFRSFEKEDEVLWPHLIYGIFYAAAKIPLEADVLSNLVQILDGALTSPCINVSTAAVESAIVYFRSCPDSLPVLNVTCAFVLKNTQLEETLNDTEVRSCLVWKLLIFIWLYGPSDGAAGGGSFEQETLGNILTALSPLNKVYVSVRLLVLKGLQKKVILKSLEADAKRKIAKAALDTLKTKNACIFFETVKLLVAIFYMDFEEFYQSSSPEPEMLMQMAERSEVFFQLLKGNIRYNSLVAAKLLPHIMMDFLPPSEILNRVIAEFMSPTQNNPELLAPVVAQLFEKARRKPKEAALVREWILSSVPNFLSNPNFSRVCWSLTLFFIGVSTSKDVIQLLPFAELRGRTLLDRNLFVHSALDFYSTLSATEKDEFKLLIKKGPFQEDDKNPYMFLIDIIEETEK